MITIGDLVGFYSRYHKQWFMGIVIDDTGLTYGRYTVVVCGKDGDYVPLNDDELTVINTPAIAEQWERKINLKNMMIKAKV